MSIAANKNKRGMNMVAQALTATDGSEHPYFELGGIWIFFGAGATNETNHAIAGATIPTGSIHMNTTTGVLSCYNGSAWKLNTQAA